MELTLKNDKLTVKLSSFGGTLTSIQDTDGTEYLWQGDATYWSGQAPILFPICGSIRNDKAVTLEGKNLSMPRHGIIRKKEFLCKDEPLMEDGAEQSATFSIASSEELYQQFPFHFEVESNYKLDGNAVVVSYTVRNNDIVAMPFFVGGHPGFNCPFDGGSYDDYYLEFTGPVQEQLPTPVTETGLIDVEHTMDSLVEGDVLPLRHALFHKDAMIFDALENRTIALKSKVSKKSVRLDFEDYPYLILWSSANDGNFVALEPWSGLSTCSDEDDVFEHKRNAAILAPSEERTYTFTITVE